MPTDGKQNISMVICGHVDSGNSTTTGRLLFELGGIKEFELEKLKAEADGLGKSCFAFYMDRQKEERERRVTFSWTIKEFYTKKWHYTVIYAPGHRDFIKNMITGYSQADVALLIVPADDNFTSTIAKGNHKAGKIQGLTRQHARLINLLGIKQLIVGVDKMDSDMAEYKQERYEEICSEMRSMFSKVGWKKEFIDESVPFLPISGWMGDNIIKKSDKMTWWSGVDVNNLNGDKIHVHTLLDALNEMCVIPKTDLAAPMRMPVSGIYSIIGVGYIVTGRVEQGTLRCNEDVIFVPTHQLSSPCTGKVFTVEKQGKIADEARPGDHVGCNIKGFVKDNIPHTGDVMIYKKDTTLKQCKSFTVQVQVLDIPGEIKVGYCPIAFGRTGHSACKVTHIAWKVGKDTGGKKLYKPHALQSNEMAEVTFEPFQRFVVETFKACEGLSRVAMLEGNGVVMLGKVVAWEGKDGK